MTSYTPARTSAVRILDHFAREGHTGGCVPDVGVLEAMIDAAFWTSLRREEGYVARVSLVFVKQNDVENAICFERPIPCVPLSLTKMAPAVERPGIHLAVGGDAADLQVWGAVRTLPPFCFVLEVVSPGVLVVKHSTEEEAGKFVNVAVLEADQVKIIDQQSATVPDCPALLTSLLGLESQFAPAHDVNVLIQLAVSIRSHGRGGTLLVVPAGTTEWQVSVLNPMTYALTPSFSGLKQLMLEDPDVRPRRRWQDALRRAVDGIAGLTAVDGATVITDDYDLLGFGAKILRRSGWPVVDRVIATEPIEGVSPAIIEPAQLGGTRHLSAAQFAHDQRNAIALVASQDGRFTVFGWSPCEAAVHAHRIESLLL